YTITRKSRTKNLVTKLYKCRQCKQQFTVTVGTIFEDSKIPLSKWFAAIYLMCASKKGISAHQLHRQLHVTYRSAWFMCHRIREAMRDKHLPLLSGTIEADETYVGGRQRGHPVERERVQDEINMGLKAKDPHPRMDKAVVFGMLERDGKVRTMHVSETSSKTLRPILVGSIDLKKSRLITDAHPAYRLIKNHLPHDVIRHESEYVRGDIHTQGIENYWSNLKRGLYGVFHHVDEAYLGNYLNEFEFRFNRRKIADENRFAALIGQTEGRLLWYCQTPQPEAPHA
ncbi:MAG: IS1595 family transposase, partial [Chloroflexi bacterium]|nr:IS1595 family transposase [Chloroflexota bacterium]